MLRNASNLATLYINFAALFNKAFEGAETQHKKLAMIAPSSTSQNEYGWLEGFPGMREWLGDRVINALAAEGYIIKNKDFEVTVGVKGNDIDDDNLGIYSPYIQELARIAKCHPDQLLATLIASGFTTLCYDGQNFFDSDHPVGTTTVSNFGGGSGTAWYLLCTKRAIKPFIFQERTKPEFVAQDDPKVSESAFMRKQYYYGVDYRGNVGFGLWQLAFASKDTLNATNYAAARAAMMSFQNEAGIPLGIKPDTLLVPPTLEGSARELLLAERDEYGATNPWKDTAEPLVWEWLA